MTLIPLAPVVRQLRLASALLSGAVALPAAQTLPDHRTWPIYGGDAAGTKFSALD